MKGIAHFLTGMALATCFAPVVQRGALGSLLPVLGGVGGLLPDVLDFRFARYWAVYDDEIDPGPEPSAQEIADALIESMRQAFEGEEARRVIARSIRLDVDLWRRYGLAFYPKRSEIEVRVGPLINGAGIPYPGTAPVEGALARRSCPVSFAHDYAETYSVEAFDGPSFRLVREGARLVVHFLDWHHRWTHSLLLGLGLGIVAGLGIHALFGPTEGWWAGLLMAGGYCAHVLEDQLGHMGCNLAWPLTRKRVPGLGWLHASDIAPNMLVSWTTVMTIFLNLARFSGDRRFYPGVLGHVGLLIFPWLFFWCGVRYRRLSAWISKILLDSEEQ
jgi:membrane-bound metal-dependent hydrolase YbcI (DUF457 family)